jgi:hypothetical protein
METYDFNRHTYIWMAETDGWDPASRMEIRRLLADWVEIGCAAWPEPGRVSARLLVRVLGADVLYQMLDDAGLTRRPAAGKRR